MTKLDLRPTDKIGGTIKIPGSKSFTNRALICAVLADGKSRLVNASPSFDSRLLVSALRQLGTKIKIDGNNTTVHGTPLHPFTGTLDIGSAGTVMRFLTALCALTPDTDLELHGSPRMHQRPIGPLVDGLRQLGAKIKYLKKSGCPPLKITGKSLTGGVVKIDGETSSQFLTALLLSAPLLPAGLRLQLTGKLASASYLEMTVQTMSKFGVIVDQPDDHTWVVAAGQKYRATEYIVETDLTGATYFAGLAAISGSKINIHPFPKNTTQGDFHFPMFLKKMGCTITHSDDTLTVHGAKKLRAITANFAQFPDSAQTLAVVAACADGTSKITGIGTLRKKECDRIEALQSEFKKLGIATRAGDDWLEIDGGVPQKNITITTFDDHRMAMAFAMLSGQIPITINHPHVVRKSFPDFWRTLQSCGIFIRGDIRIIPSVIGRTVDELLEIVKTLPPKLELIELRVDALEHVSKSMLDDLRQRVDRPAILTCRRAAEGGYWKSSEIERVELLEYAATQRWTFVDVELAIASDWPWEKFKKQAFLLSWHDFEKTPDDLEKIWNEMRPYPAIVKKIVPTAVTDTDTKRILDLAERHASQNLITFGMGEPGQYTRFESLRRGTWAMFAAADTPTAPGQQYWRKLQKIIEPLRYPR